MQNLKELMEALLDKQVLKFGSIRIRLDKFGYLETSTASNEWVPTLSSSGLYIVPSKWQIIPKTININGFEVPAPERSPLKYGTLYYKTNIDTYHSIPEYVWEDDTPDRVSLTNGYVHLTRNAAEIHRNALLSFTKSS